MRTKKLILASSRLAVHPICDCSCGGYPFLWRQGECIETCVPFKPIEFDRFKIWIENSLPHSKVFSFLCFQESVFLFKVFLSYSTGWTYPVFREVFKWCSCRDAAFRIPFCRIVNVSAENAYISVHSHKVFRHMEIQLSDQ